MVTGLAQEGGAVARMAARSIWSGTISFGHIDDFPHQTR
jgi:hypothetical protein